MVRPNQPSRRSARVAGPRRRRPVATAWATSMYAGAERAVPLCSESRPTCSGLPRIGPTWYSWRRFRATAKPSTPVASCAADVLASSLARSVLPSADVSELSVEALGDVDVLLDHLEDDLFGGADLVHAPADLADG